MADLVFTKEEKAPQTTIVMNLKEQIQAPWVFKMGSEKASKLAKDVQRMYDEGKELWFKTLVEEIMGCMSYKWPPKELWGIDKIKLEHYLMMVVEAFKQEYSIAQNPPKQKQL